MSAARPLHSALPAVVDNPATQPIPVQRKAPTAIQPEPRHLQLAEGDVQLAKSLALAEARNLVYRATWSTQHDLGEGWRFREIFEVPSYSHPGQVHRVVFEHQTMALRCECVAGSFLAPCSHKGAVLHLIRRLGGLMTRTEDAARREQMDGARFDEDAQLA